MEKLFLIAVIALTIGACSSNSSAGNNHTDTAIAVKPKPKSIPAGNNLLADTAKVKAWLTGVIEDYTNGKDPKAAFEDLRKSLTDDYYNYKQDAINLEYDNCDAALTAKTFKKKWQNKYNTKFVGSGGFLISAQDNGKVKVTHCHLMKQLEQNASLYKVLIEDLDFKSKFDREIKVVDRGGKLLIDDVVERD